MIPPEAPFSELVAELIRGLAGTRAVGSIRDGQPYLRLFDADERFTQCLAALRARADQAREAEAFELDAKVEGLHLAATSNPEGYLISAAGLNEALGRGPKSDEGVAGDVMSLRLHTSSFYAPLDGLLRVEPDDPTSWAPLFASLRGAAQSYLARQDLPSTSGFVQRCNRLREHLLGLERIDDPRAPRVLAELFVHAALAVNAVRSQRPFVRNPTNPIEGPAWLHWACDLPIDALERLQIAADESRLSWHFHGLLGINSTAAACEHEAAARKPCNVELRPMYRGSAARWLDAGGVGVCPGPVVFPPGTRFAVQTISELEDGRTLIRLAERSRLAAAWARTPLPSVNLATPLYHYTLGQSIPSIVDDGEIGVATPLPGSSAPVTWLSTCQQWEASAVKSAANEDGTMRELSVAELAEVGRGLFRIGVSPDVGVIPWATFADRVGLDPALVRTLDDRGRARGADPKQWYCCPWSVPRDHWTSIEMYQPNHGWIPLEI